MNKIEYCLKNDSTVILTIKIENQIIQDEYSFLEGCRAIPKFITKYKDSFIFLNGTGFSYRLVTLYKLNNKKIVKYSFTNYYMPERGEAPDRLLFLYNSQPAILSMHNHNIAIKFYKRHYPIKPNRIEYITIERKGMTMLFKNNKLKSFKWEEFGQ
jgi:hypothetical protein